MIEMKCLPKENDEDFDEFEELEDDSGSKIETREEVNGNELKNTSYIYIF